MSELTAPLLYEEEYSIQKRADGTEDFHCIIASCVGVFSYRTLRALNNHRISSHSLPDIPKRKRGPKKSESSRMRCRSADAIKRQVMKRAIDISKREQGCRSMARLRASRLAMAQAAGGLVNNNDRITSVVQEVDKLLQNWEGDSCKRRSLLERRIQMARLEWTMRGEALPLPADNREVDGRDDRLCLDDHETGEKREFPSVLLEGGIGKAAEGSATDEPQAEMSISEPIRPDNDNFAGTAGVQAIEMDDLNGSLCDIEAHFNGDEGLGGNVSCNDVHEIKHVWHNYSVRKFVSVNQHKVLLLSKRLSAQQADKIISFIDRDERHIEYDSRLFCLGL